MGKIYNQLDLDERIARSPSSCCFRSIQAGQGSPAKGRKMMQQSLFNDSSLYSSMLLYISFQLVLGFSGNES